MLQSIALLQLTKRYLRMTAIVLKIRKYASNKNTKKILQRICFEMRKNNSNFTFRQFVFFVQEGFGANASNAFLLERALLRFSVYFLQFNNLR